MNLDPVHHSAGASALGRAPTAESIPDRSEFLRHAERTGEADTPPEPRLETLLTLEPFREIAREVLRESPQDASMRARIEAGKVAPDDPAYRAYRDRSLSKLLNLQIRLQDLQFHIEFANKVVEHGVSAGKTVLQTQL